MVLRMKSSELWGKLPRKSNPVSIHRNGPGKLAVVDFETGVRTVGSCLRCPVPPCHRYVADEIVLNDYFRDFPADTSIKVCPTDAIQIGADSGVPQVIHEKCLSCGLCVSRCPVQAIEITAKGAEVNDSENEYFKLTGEPVDPKAVAEVTRLFRSLPIDGSIAGKDSKLGALVYRRIGSVGMRSGAQFPNLLVRNIIVALGIPFHVRRLGDTNVRFDAVFKSGPDRIGVAEIEVNEGAMMDAPRNLLDDCAVLKARHSYPLERIDPLVISVRLPNVRSEYWRVIQDISSVLNVRIGSITVGTLLLLLWGGFKLEPDAWHHLYADAANPTIEPFLKEKMGDDLHVLSPDPGWYKSAK